MKADQLFDVRGHVAVVTGAASGIGLAFAEVMAANGAFVALLDVDAPGVERAAAQLRAAGGEVEARVVDVAQPGPLRAAIDAVAAARGRLDAVFANAGISAGPSFQRPGGDLASVDLAAWQRVLDVNLNGVFATVQAAARHMKAKRAGRIVVTSSIAGLRGDPIVGYAYAVTKAAVNNLVRQAALELAPYNVMVNAIAPGAFMTNIGGGRWRDPQVAKQFTEASVLGRMAHTDEIKGLALLLASPAASYLTGAVIPIDGGASAR